MRKCVPLALALGLTTGCPDFVEGAGPSSATSFGTGDVSGPSSGIDGTSTSQGSAESLTGGETDPTDATDSLPDVECGNGLIEPGELCDEGDENGIGSCKDTCAPNYCGDNYLGPGELCDDGNQTDGDACTSMCTTPNCGNSNVEAPEECDDGNGNNNDDCLTTCLDAECGDQQIHAVLELCDSENVGVTTCAEAGPFQGGVLVCNGTCDGYDTSSCYACGDGAINPGEQCDDDALGGATCPGMGFDNGTPLCAGNCTLDYSPCWECGDAQITGPEVCEAGNLNGATCVSQGFDGGTLGCNASCMYNTGPCHECGDGMVEGPETCEMGQTIPCDDLLGAAYSTTVNATCNASCMWNSSGCCLVTNAVCDGDPACCSPGNCGGENRCCLPNGTMGCSTGGGDYCCGMCVSGTCQA